MNKKILTLLITGVIAGTTLSVYRYNTTEPTERKTIRKLQYVTPKIPQRNPLKNQQVSSCPEKRLKSLRLLHNNNIVWKKTHDELFALDQVITSDDRRLKGKNQIIPLDTFIDTDKNITLIDVTECNGIIKTLTLEDLAQTDITYYIGLNNKGWLKVMRKDLRARYVTFSKGVIEINLRDKEQTKNRM